MNAIGKPRVSASENAACCPVCDRAYEWATDGPFGIGRLVAIHPVGPCVPPKPVVFEPESDGVVSRQQNTRSTVKCLACLKVFEQRSYLHLYCSTKCRSRHLWAAKAWRAACAICEKTFTTTSSRKDTCSAACRRVRKRRYMSKWMRENYWKLKAAA